MTRSKPLLIFVQPKLRGELAVPMDIAAIIGNLPADAFRVRVFDLNIGARGAYNELMQLVSQSEHVFVSAFCVSIFNERRDWPDVLTLLRELREAGATSILVGSRTPVSAAMALQENGIQFVYGDLENLFSTSALDFAKQKSRCLPEARSLDELGFCDFSHFDLARYPTSMACAAPLSLPLLTSRGCNRGCTYCGVRRGYSARPAHHVVSEIRQKIGVHGVTHFVIEDDLFNHESGHVKSFCRELLASGLSITWECLNGLHPDEIDNELLDLMIEAGCRHVALGIESFSGEVLARVGRATDHERLDVLLSHAERSSLLVTGYFLLDLLEHLPLRARLVELRTIKAAAIAFPHFTYSDGRDGIMADWFKRACYLYVYADERRLRTLLSMGAFSSKKFGRLWSKWKRG
ncbi:MAG: hypothetical protein A2X94_07955 [Bdellovibrionales bacterium GWB1_55_8]|nr:MAG: hypothetical protein A2X94_07955 [Bdellovibrionales bacterium GWB1_55_8]